MQKLIYAVALCLVVTACGSPRCTQTHWVKEGASEADSVALWRAAWQETDDVRAVWHDGMNVYAYNEWNKAVLVHRMNTVEARMHAAGYAKVRRDVDCHSLRPADAESEIAGTR